MKYKELEQQLQELRQLYKELENPADKEKLNVEGKEKADLLKASFGCYECDNLLPKAQLPDATCSPECHETWASKNYNTQKETRRLTIQEMQKKLRKMALEAKAREFVKKK